MAHWWGRDIMQKPLLLQIDSADPFYHGMIELHRERHQAYAQRHGYEYWVDPPPGDSSQWFRIETIKAALDDGYSHVFYLDADACVADLSVDLRDAINHPTWIGLTVHPFGFGSNMQWHFNTGVIYMRNGPEAKTYVRDVLRFHGEAAWDQEPMNELLMHVDVYQGGYRPLHQRWNQNMNHPASRHAPIVAAWHGDGTPLQRLARMQRWERENPWRK